MKPAIIFATSIVILSTCGCQSITCRADNGATITINDSNSKPINAGVEANAGDAALSAAAALAGGGVGGSVAGLPGAAAGAGIGYLAEQATAAVCVPEEPKK